MSSPEHNIETLVMAILAGHDTLASVDIDHHVEDTDTAAKPDRITVKCDPAISLLGGRSPSKPVLVWQAVVTVEAMHSGTETAFDSWRDAIDEQLNAISYDAGVITSATEYFPNGLELTPPEGGAIFETPDKRRTITRQFRAIFQS